VAQVEQFRPEKSAEDFPIDFGNEAAPFARDFQLLADLIENSGSESESFALYLSTCRNAYLTINGMFFDIRETFGKVSPSEGIFGALQDAQGGAFNSATAHLDRVGLGLGAFDDKRACWACRKKFQDLLESLLGKLSHLDRQTLRATLNDVVDQDGRSDLASVRQFLAFDSVETDAQRSLIQKLAITAQKLRRVRECAIRIKDVGEEIKKISLAQAVKGQQAGLFDEPPMIKQKAIEFRQWLESGGGNPEMEIVNTALDQTSHQCRNALDVLTGSDRMEDVMELLTIFCQQLQNATGEEYTDLGKSFRPNIGKSPLPSVFLIDLTDQLPPKADNTTAVIATPFLFSQAPLEKLVVAIAQPPISSSELSSARIHYRTEDMRHIAGDWALLAIEEAATKSNLVVFPELFVPEYAFPAIMELAKKNQIGVVCGMEGNWTDNKYSNFANVFIPGAPHEYQQFKKHPSNYEPENFHTKGGQLCFLQSAVGSFSVIICSDLREFDVIAAVESQPFLDYLVICCCNPYSEIWKHLAIADAARLHSFIILSNWSEHSDADGYGCGSLCAIPTGKVASNLQAEPQIRRVSLVKGDKTFNGSLRLHELDMSALFRDREKPKAGFLSPPRRRLHINRR
jgi:predicted amidohydrolase